MKVFYTLFLLIFSVTAGYACSPGGTLNVNTNTTISANACHTNLDFSNNRTLTIQSPAVLTIDGPVVLNNRASIIINSGATLIINGNFTVNNGFTLTNSGSFVLNGTFTANNNPNITIGGTGNLDISGDMNTGNNSTIVVDGTATVDGSVNIGAGGISSFTVNGTVTIGTEYTNGPDFTGNGFVYENGIQIYPTLLPITLSYFGGTCNDGENEILWVTSSENNSSHFILERSDNATEWQAISQVQAAGQSSEEIEYIVNDADGGRNALSYYRLHQYDFNGENAVYGPISIVCENPKELKPTGVLAPNPTAEASYLTISNSPLGDAMITLLGMNGQIIYTERLIVSKQNDSYFIDSLDLNRGLYIIRFEAPDGQIVAMKLIKN